MSSRLVRIMFSLSSLVTDGGPAGPQLAARRSLTAFDAGEGDSFKELLRYEHMVHVYIVSTNLIDCLGYRIL